MKKSNIPSKKSTKAFGDSGEQRASDFLEHDGYTIIERNWRTRSGEVDIIALKNSVLVFVEVKTLANGTTDTLEIILGTLKQKKIIQTAKLFLQKYRQYIQYYIRFDVLVVDMPGLPPIYHIEDAFTESA